MRILFMGTPEFAVASLRRLVEAGHTICGVLTQPDKPRNRGHKVTFSPVKEYALSVGLDVYQPVTLRDEAALELVKGLAPELTVVAAYGAYQKAITIYNLPSSFMVAITASVIPAISACRARRDYQGAGRIAESSMRMGMLLALPAGIGLSVLASPIMYLLYAESDHTIADPSMMILGIASIFVCVMLVCSSVLQASGFVNLPIVIMVAGCAAKLIVNNFMVRHVGAVGAAVGTLVCYVIVAVLELLLIKRVIPSPPEYTRVFAKPMVAAGVMGMAVWAAYGLVSRIFGNTLSTMAAIGVGVAVYAVLVVALKAISREDLSLMPKGDQIARLLRL